MIVHISALTNRLKGLACSVFVSVWAQVMRNGEAGTVGGDRGW